MITLLVLTSLMVKSTIVVIIQILIEIPLVQVIGLIVLQVPPLVAGQDTAKIWNNEVAQFFVWYDADADDSIEGYEIAVKFQNGNINAWGIDNRQFDTFQNVNC